MMAAVALPHSQRPYFDAWLRRARKQFAVSGMLSQVASTLARQDGVAEAIWRERLRSLLDGDGSPSLDLLTRIDALLAGHAGKNRPPLPNEGENSQQELF
jgi:hypothetical protein